MLAVVTRIADVDVEIEWPPAMLEKITKRKGSTKVVASYYSWTVEEAWTLTTISDGEWEAQVRRTWPGYSLKMSHASRNGRDVPGPASLQRRLSSFTSLGKGEYISKDMSLLMETISSPSSTAKLLGVVFDQELRWKSIFSKSLNAPPRQISY